MTTDSNSSTELWSIISNIIGRRLFSTTQPCHSLWLTVHNPIPVLSSRVIGPIHRFLRSSDHIPHPAFATETVVYPEPCHHYQHHTLANCPLTSTLTLLPPLKYNSPKAVGLPSFAFSSLPLSPCPL